MISAGKRQTERVLPGYAVAREGFLSSDQERCAIGGHPFSCQIKLGKNEHVCLGQPEKQKEKKGQLEPDKWTKKGNLLCRSRLKVERRKNLDCNDQNHLLYCKKALRFCTGSALHFWTGGEQKR